MPSMSYYHEPLPGVNLEIVSLDTNVIDAGPTCKWIERFNHQDRNAGWTPRNRFEPACNEPTCRYTMGQRTRYAFELLRSRVEAARQTGRQLIVFSHYPSNWLHAYSHNDGRTFNDLLSTPGVSITYFSGHVHSTDNTTNVNTGLRRHGWNDFCVGGGGGWACDDSIWVGGEVGFSPSQGFVAGEIRSDGMVVNLKLEMIPDKMCCRGNSHG